MTDELKACKLLSCPFCGHSPEYHSDLTGRKWLRCKSCFCGVDPQWYRGDLGAVEAAWNTRHERAIPEDAAERIKCLEELVNSQEKIISNLTKKSEPVIDDELREAIKVLQTDLLPSLKFILDNAKTGSDEWCAQDRYDAIQTLITHALKGNTQCLIDALEFYADQDNWDKGTIRPPDGQYKKWMAASCDKGNRAREALSALKGESK